MSGIINSAGSKSGVIGPSTFADTPAFWVYGNGTQSSIGAGYTTCSLNDEIFDNGSNFDHNTTYTFTAPVTGLYHFDAHLKMEYVLASLAWLNFMLTFTFANMTDREPYATIETSIWDQEARYFGMHHLSLDTKMDAGDTCVPRVYSPTVGNVGNIVGTGTYLAGHLIR